MNHLPHLIQFLVDFNFGAVESFLSKINGFDQQPTAFLYGPRVTAFLKFDALVFEEAA